MAGRPEQRGENAKEAKCEPASPDLPAALTSAALPGHDLEDGGVYELLAFSDMDLAGREAAGAEIEACRYVNVNLSSLKLRRVLLRDVAFERCDMASMRAVDCSFTRMSISACRMTGLSWLDDKLRDVTFTGCKLDLSSFRASNFDSVVFADCRMEDADFADADLRGARFENCSLTRAQFSGARMGGTRFSRCDLTGIGGVTSMRGAIISSTDAVALADVLASALGIKIEDDPPVR